MVLFSIFFILPIHNIKISNSKIGRLDYLVLLHVSIWNVFLTELFPCCRCRFQYILTKSYIEMIQTSHPATVYRSASTAGVLHQ